MGLCQSEEEKKQAKESRAIDKKIKESQAAEEKIIKLLLLGAGECGKSTLMKQMRILHSNGFSEEELLQQRSVVYSNTVHAMAELLRAMHMYKLPFMDPKRELDARIAYDTIRAGEETEPFSPELALALKRLWADETISVTTYARRLEFHLHETAKHFFDNLDRISDPNYMPTDQDILYTRIKTTGIVEVGFVIKGVQFRVFDVGGQRSERKKWIHCFEDVHAIIFITAVSEYDEVLFEDNTTNRMIESMRLFESICNSRWFINTSIILFLNKKDLFAEKIKHFSIKKAFPEYTGPQTYDDSINYIRKKFDRLNANPRKTIFVHQTVGIIEQVITGETGEAKSASPKTPKVRVHATPDEPRYLIRNLKTGKRTAYKRYNIMRKANEEEVETKHSDFSLDKDRSRHAEPPPHGVPLAQ